MIKPRIIFLSKLILFSFVAHCLFLALFFLAIQQNKVVQLHVSGITSEVDWSNVVLVPLAKHIPPQPKKTATKPVIAAKTPTKISEKKGSDKQPQATTMQTQVVEKKIVAKPKDTNKNTVIAKTTQSTKQTTSSEKKAVAQVAQKSVVKSEAKKPSFPEKTTIPQVLEPEKIYIGRNDRDLLLAQQELYSQLLLHWQPPAGIAENIFCCVKATITKEGAVADVSMDTSSNILVFDVAARSAIFQTEFPQSVWGKEVLITFNQ